MCICLHTHTGVFDIKERFVLDYGLVKYYAGLNVSLSLFLCSGTRSCEGDGHQYQQQQQYGVSPQHYSSRRASAIHQGHPVAGGNMESSHVTHKLQHRQPESAGYQHSEFIRN